MSHILDSPKHANQIPFNSKECPYIWILWTWLLNHMNLGYLSIDLCDSLFESLQTFLPNPQVHANITV